MKKSYVCITVLMLMFGGLFLSLNVKAATEWSMGKTYTVSSEDVTYRAYLNQGRSEAWIYDAQVTLNRQTKVHIPAKVEGIPVTRIGAVKYEDEECYSSVFQGATRWIYEMILPNSIKEINPATFSNLGNMMTINIPAGVKKLEMQTFESCNSLQCIKFAKGKYQLSQYAFGDFKGENYCIMSDGLDQFKPLENHTEIYYQDGMIFTADKKKLVWVNGGVETLKVPQGVLEISEEAVKDRDVTKAILPASVKAIKNDAFTSSQAIQFKISSKNKRYGVKNKCVYSKVSKRLVVGVLDSKGVMNIPSTVKRLSPNCSLVGGTVNKLKIPKSVTKLEKGWYDSNKYGIDGTKIYFSSLKAPNKGKDIIPMNAKIYVPKKAYKAYKSWMKSDKESAAFSKLLKK